PLRGGQAGHGAHLLVGSLEAFDEKSAGLLLRFWQPLLGLIELASQRFGLFFQLLALGGFAGRFLRSILLRAAAAHEKGEDQENAGPPERGDKHHRCSFLDAKSARITPKYKEA